MFTIAQKNNINIASNERQSRNVEQYFGVGGVTASLSAVVISTNLNLFIYFGEGGSKGS